KVAPEGLLAGTLCCVCEAHARGVSPARHGLPLVEPKSAALRGHTASLRGLAPVAAPIAVSGVEQPAQDEREDAAVAEVLALARRVQAQAGAEDLVIGPHGHLACLRVVDALDRELLAAGQAERRGALTVHELQ